MRPRDLSLLRRKEEVMFGLALVEVEIGTGGPLALKVSLLQNKLSKTFLVYCELDKMFGARTKC